jgi:Uma2 family endonuclease
MGKTAVRVGPADHGRCMTLDEFDLAEGQEGHLYELSRGVVTVTEVPNIRHGLQVDAIREQFSAYRQTHRGVIHAVLSGAECKLLIAGLESERHPDLAIYKTPPPDEDVWSTWVPELVIEVVSPSSRRRDYEEKPDEYLRFGVREYWIIDEERQEMLVLSRKGGKWAARVVRPTERYRTSKALLPDFEFDLAAVFAAAAAH